jgi:hypothetical protein
LAARDARWSEAVAVGSRTFVEKVKSDLAIKALHRELIFSFERESVGTQKSKIDWATPYRANSIFK